MEQYVVRICFIINDNPNQSNQFNQYYSVNENKMIILKHLNIILNGTCCTKYKCFACKVGGIKIKYNGYFTLLNQEIVKFFCQKPLYSLDSLLGFVNRSLVYDNLCSFGVVNLINFMRESTKKHLEEIWQKNNSLNSLMLNVINNGDYPSLLKFLDILKFKLGDENMFDRYVENIDNYVAWHILYEIKSKYKLKKTMEVIKKYYRDNMMLLEYCGLLLNLNHKEANFVKARLETYMNIKVFETEKKLELRYDKK